MWKTLIRYRVYQSASGGVRVFQNPLFRWLQFESKAIQTLINRYFPQRPGLSYLKFLVLGVQLQPGHCCMLGLGGGGAAHVLSPLLRSDKLLIVESNKEVIDIASRFFMIDRLNNVSIVHLDANLFLQECHNPFQHLLVDLFDDHAFPASCYNEAFFANCKRQLSPGGILAVNLANRNEQWPIFKLIQQQFGNSTLALPALDSTNMIIFAQNSNSISLFLDLLKENKKLKTLTWDNKWGYVATLR